MTREDIGDFMVILLIIAISLFVYTHSSKADCVNVGESDRWEYYDQESLLLRDYNTGDAIARVGLAEGCVLKPNMSISREVYLCEGNTMVINKAICTVDTVVTLDNDN